MAAVLRCCVLVAFAACVAATPSFPGRFPNSYSATIEANFGEGNFTLDLREYYDYDNNMMRVESHRRDHSVIQIYRYNEDLHVDITNGRCTSYNVTANPRRAGFSFDRDSHHIRTASDFWDTDKTSYSYQGKDVVRGISAEHWLGNDSFNFTNRRTEQLTVVTFNLHWYFAQPQWNFRGFTAHQIPLRLIVEGTDTNMVTGASRQFVHNYEWINFDPVTPGPWMFHIPPWAFCPALMQKPMPQFPTQFYTVHAEVNVETTDPNNDDITYEVREYYDYEHAMLRIDNHRHDQHVTEIYDINNRTHWDINQATGECEVESADDLTGEEKGFFNYFVDKDKHAKRISDLFELNSVNFTYGGETRARGIECEQWQGQRLMHSFEDGWYANYTMNYCFADSDWKFKGEPSLVRPLVRIHYNGTYWRNLNGVITNFTSFRNWINFIEFTSVRPGRHLFRPPHHVFCPARTSKPFPTTAPEAFAFSVEVNVPSFDMTFDRREWLDLPQQRFRISHFDNETIAHDIFHLDTGLHFRVENGECSVRPFNSTRFVRRGHWVTSHAIHALTSTPAVYGGQREVREIDVDQWRMAVTRHSRFRGTQYLLKYNHDWYFAKDDWKTFGETKSLKNYPVGSRINGTWTNLTSGHSGRFERYETVTAVEVGSQSSHLFDIPAVCQGKNPAVDCSNLNIDDCASLNRQPCGVLSTPNTCGPCHSGFTGLSGAGNTVCHAVGAFEAAGGNKPLPILPNDFSVTIEANIMEKDYSLYIQEYHDFTNNRLRLERYRRNESVVSIYDYNTQRHYNVVDGHCRTHNTSASPRGDPFSSEGHLRSTADLFRETKDLNWEFGGLTRARGIECNRWRARTTRNFTRNGVYVGMDYTMEWCFAEDEWQRRGQQHDLDIPIRLTLNGTETVIRDSVTTTTPFYHFYEFIDFVPGAPSHFLFYPHHVFCADIVNKPFPGLTIPDAWQSNIEVNVLDFNGTWEMKEYYDWNSNKVRLEFYAQDKKEVEIYDGNTGMHFNLTGEGASATCKVTALAQENGRRNFISYNMSTHHLNHIVIQDADKAQYGGIRYIRGIRCDRWRIMSSFKMGPVTVPITSDWYYAVPEWKVFGQSQQTHGSIVQATFSGSYMDPKTNTMKHFLRENTYTGLRIGPQDPALFEIPLQCSGMNPDPAVDCSSISESDCTLVNREPCFYTSNTCGPCRTGFATVPDAPPTAIPRCYPINGGPVTIDDTTQGVEKGTTAGLSIGLFFAGLGVGLCFYFCATRARRGFYKLQNTGANETEMDTRMPDLGDSANAEPQLDRTDSDVI